MNTLILGNGWLGQMLYKYLSSKSIDVGFYTEKLKTGWDIPESGWSNADVVINTIAKTNIDWCEQNKVHAFFTNTTLALQLAQRCVVSQKQYVFFSSACIFQSRDINDIKYEDSEPNPACFYSKTKALAEELIREANPSTLIIRPRLPISEVPHPRNTINKVLSYLKLHDNQESVTVVEDMFPILLKLIQDKKSGAFNIVNSGTISPAQIADAFNHPYEKFSKDDEVGQMKNEGRAIRVTTIADSRRLSPLPDIRERMNEIVKVYNSHL